jgi:hypothetical protein
LHCNTTSIQQFVPRQKLQGNNNNLNPNLYTDSPSAPSGISMHIPTLVMHQIALQHSNSMIFLSTKIERHNGILINPDLNPDSTIHQFNADHDSSIYP